MKLSERIVLSTLLYPLWRTAWIERTFFHICRLFNRAEQAAFQLYNFGFDVSKWQGFINFIKMVAYGAKFLILRCAYGIKIDERFVENMAGVGNLLPLSAYHYYDPIYSPESQAAKVIEVLAPYKNRIRRVWLDLEFYWSGSYSDPKHWKTYRDRIKAAGYRIGWYTRATWWDSRVGSYSSEFAKDPCWAAQYNNSLTLIPKDWTKVTIWQNGILVVANGEAGTDSKEIDNDIWNDEFSFFDEWNKELNGGTPPDDPPTEPPGEPIPTVTTYHLTVTASPAKRWSDAACTNRIYPDIPNGTKLESQVKSGSNYYTGNGYVKGSHVRLDYTETVEEPTNPPPGEEPTDPPPAVTLPATLKGFDSTGTEIPGAIWDKRNAP